MTAEDPHACEARDMCAMQIDQSPSNSTQNDRPPVGVAGQTTTQDSTYRPVSCPEQ